MQFAIESDILLDNIRNFDSILRIADILSEMVWRHKWHHISLDDMLLYAACNDPIWGETMILMHLLL